MASGQRKRRGQILLPLLGVLALVALFAVGAMPSQRARAASTPILPGEPLWGSVPAWLYGVNDSVNWDPQYNMDVAPDGPPIQAAIKKAQVPIARTWFFQNSLVDGHAMSDAEQLTKLHAVQNAGMVCFANFPTANTVAYDLHLLSLLNGACPFVEVMNEPDNAGISAVQYLSFWNSFVPQARKAYPGILFGGPAATTPQYSDCSYPHGQTICFLQKVLTGMAQSGNLPDFVTFHWYPCWNDTASSCLAKASTYTPQAQMVTGWVQQDFPGKSIPVGISEWNADPGNPAYMQNQSWMAQYLTAALNNMQQSGLAFAMFYDVAGYANYGTDDLFDIYTNNGAPKQQFNALAADIAAAQGGGNSTPTPTATSSPSPSPTATQSPTPSPTPTQSPTPSPTPTQSPTPSPSPSPSPTPPPGGLTFSDGFESGNAAAWAVTHTGAGDTLAVESSNVHSGTYALGMVKGARSGDVYVQANLASPGLSASQTTWAMELANPQGHGMLQLVQISTGNYFLAGLYLTYNASSGHANLQLYDGNYKWHSCTLPKTLYGAWHTYSLSYVAATSATGSFSLRIDGATVCSASNLKTARTRRPALTSAQFGSIGSDGRTSMAIWLDDVRITAFAPVV
ncbi:MAG: hypothetical protein ABI068_03870 [Ktedonobacterales bacterium]